MVEKQKKISWGEENVIAIIEKGKKGAVCKNIADEVIDIWQDKNKILGLKFWVPIYYLWDRGLYQGMYKNRVKNDRNIFEIPAPLFCKRGNSEQENYK